MLALLVQERGQNGHRLLLHAQRVLAQRDALVLHSHGRLVALQMLAQLGDLLSSLHHRAHRRGGETQHTQRLLQVAERAVELRVVGRRRRRPRRKPPPSRTDRASGSQRTDCRRAAVVTGAGCDGLWVAIGAAGESERCDAGGWVQQRTSVSKPIAL